MKEQKFMGWFNITRDDFNELVRRKKNPETRNVLILFLVGIFLSAISMIGALIGYARAYNRFMRPKGELPVLGPLRPIVRFAMIAGGILAWAVLIGFFLLLLILMGGNSDKAMALMGFLLAFVAVNLIICLIIFSFFRNWRAGMNKLAIESQKFGTARFASNEDLLPYSGPEGLFIGGEYFFADKGHVLTVAGTRGGKGTNLIIPNLLGIGNYKGSWVVIDPKAENAAITSRYQRETGHNVVVLNPWGLLQENIGEAQSYNPLDIVSDIASIHLIDDIQIIAEMIVPIEKGDRDNFFTDNARAIVAGLLLHLVTSQKQPSLVSLWEWVRLPKEDWNNLLGDMASSDDPVNSSAINRAAYEILQLQAAGDKTFGSIIATVLQCTDFLKSFSLQKSLVSGFQPKALADGKTCVYIIIPADKLQSHARWLRLVTITMLRAVVRNPNKQVTFLLDEFAALGYLPEIENALSTYAGYNITVWPILQSLIQLKSIYKDIWETFVANATIRQFFSINDNFTAEYVSKAMGQTSNVVYEKSLFGVGKVDSNARQLITADELRRSSGENIFAFMGDRPPTYFPKRPYYKMWETTGADGKSLYDENPYLTVKIKETGKTADVVL